MRINILLVLGHEEDMKLVGVRVEDERAGLNGDR